MPKADPRQVNVRLPQVVYDRLRLLNYELHKSNTKIITEALVLYDEAQQRAKARKLAAAAAEAEPKEVPSATG